MAGNENLLLERKAKAPLLGALPMAMQHVVAMVVGCITMPMIVAGAAGADGQTQIIMVQASLLVAALAILLQASGFKGIIGSGLPLMVGSGFAFLPTLRMLAQNEGLGAVFGAQIAGGLLGILVGLSFKKIRFLFPPVVTGSVVLTIGISLYTTAVNYMAGGAGAADFGSMRNWAVAGVTLLTVIICGQFFKGVIKSCATLIGIVAGYATAAAMGMVSFDAIGSAALVQLPKILPVTPVFGFSAILSLGIVFVVNAVQDVGQIEATAEAAYGRSAENNELVGGVVANNFMSALAGVFGGVPVAAAGQNVGIVATTKVVNRRVFVLAGGIVLAAALSPKLSALFVTIPMPVLGGATISVFASIAMTGIKMLAKEGLSPRSTFIAGLSVALAVGIPRIEGVFQGFPAWVGRIFGGSEVIIVAITAILLNLIIPKEKEQKK